jgi:acyl transferase domain-containing protein
MALATKINPSSVFLVSGGAKGITGKCVTKLVKHHPCKFILLGRSSISENEPDWAENYSDESQLKKLIMENLLAKGEKPTPMVVQGVFRSITSSREIKNTLQAIEQVGGQAEYIDVDITDISALRQKLEATISRMGPITGIIHGAGNLADKLIEKKTEQDFETVYTAKVQGLENLLACVSPSQLDYLVLFSSVAGFYGNAGQTDYAIANEILNKSAHLFKQNHPDCHVVAINWGPWDSGMVTPELKKAFAERNVEVIPIEVGAQLLVNELDKVNHEIAQVVIGSPLIPPVVASKLKPDLLKHRIRRRLTMEANPFLQDHTINGYPVLPATCATAWMVHTCEQLYPGYKFFSTGNCKVLKGIIFDQSLADEYVLDIQEIAKSDSEIEFEAKIWSERPNHKIPFLYHFSALIKLVREIPHAPTYEPLDLTEDGSFHYDKASFYQNGGASLFHGPAFQGARRVLNISPEKITLECFLPRIGDREQGQFPVGIINPYINDVYTHAPWIWTEYFHQQRYLPAQLDLCEQFSTIPFDQTFYVSSVIRNVNESYVLNEMIAHDDQGKIYCQLFGALGSIFRVPSEQAVSALTSQGV